jgi:hypothetical protein
MTARPTDIDVAIRRYQAAATGSSGESPAKIEAIRQLEPHMAHPEAERFLVSVLLDPAEYDLARVEVCRALQASSAGSSGGRYADALLRLLQSEDDTLVRQWAANALRVFRDHPGVVRALASRLAKATEDLDVRHNAIASLRGAAMGLAERELLEPLRTDPELGHAVNDLLQDDVQ